MGHGDVVVVHAPDDDRPECSQAVRAQQQRGAHGDHTPAFANTQGRGGQMRVRALHVKLQRDTHRYTVPATTVPTPDTLKESHTRNSAHAKETHSNAHT